MLPTLSLRHACVYSPVLCLLVALSAAGTPACAAPGEPAAAATAAEAEKLIPLLDSESFRTRTQAVGRLRSLGLDAARVIHEAIDNPPSLETKLQLEQLWQSLQEQHPIETLLIERDVASLEEWPLWRRFAQTAGDGVDAQRYFVRMLKAEPELFRVAGGGKGSADEYLRVMAQRFTNAGVRFGQPGNAAEETIAAMAFVAADPATKTSDGTAVQINSALQRIYSDIPKSGPGRKMVGHWLTRADQSVNTTMALYVAQRAGLDEEGLELALRVLRDNNRNVFSPQAIVMVGQFGKKEHIPLLEKYFKDSQRCGGMRRGDGPQIWCERRDVALAMCVMLAGKEPAEFGFPYAQRGDRNQYLSYIQYGFADDNARNTAFEQWEKYKKAEGEKE